MHTAWFLLRWTFTYCDEEVDIQAFNMVLSEENGVQLCIVKETIYLMTIQVTASTIVYKV